MEAGDVTDPTRNEYLAIGALLTVLIGGFVLFTYLYFPRHLAGECGDDVVVSIPSPDRRYVAVVFRRGCGATVGVLYQHLNLRDSGKAFRKDRDGCITDGEVWRSGEWGRVVPTWKDAKHLVVVGGSSIHERDQITWRDVTISEVIEPL